MCSSTWELHQWLAIDDKSSQNQFFFNFSSELYWSSKVCFVYMTGLCWCSTSVVGPLEIQLYRGFHMQAPNNFYWLQIWITKCCQNIHQNRVNPSKIDQKSLARSKSTSCNQFVFVTLQTDNNTVFGRKQPQRRPTKWLPNPLEKAEAFISFMERRLENLFVERSKLQSISTRTSICLHPNIK